MILQGVKLEVMRKTWKYQKSTFAINLIMRREKLGLTAEKFAELAAIPYPTLRDLEVGRTQGSLRTKEKIAQALSTTIDALNIPRNSTPTEKSDSLGRLISILPALDESKLGQLLRFAERLSEGAVTLEQDDFSKQHKRIK